MPRKPREPEGRDPRPPSAMTPRQWFSWFMANHRHDPLIEAGLWKRPGLIAADLRDEDIGVMQAAYLVAGPVAVWPVLIALLKEIDTPLPDEVEARGNEPHLRKLGLFGRDYIDWDNPDDPVVKAWRSRKARR